MMKRIAKLLLLSIFLNFLHSAFGQEAAGQKVFKILVIFPSMEAGDWPSDFNNGLYNHLLSRKEIKTGIYYLYLGLDLVPSTIGSSEILDTLEKNADLIKPDAVVSIFPATHSLMLEYGDTVFPGIAKIYVPVISPLFDAISKQPDSFIINSSSEYAIRETLLDITEIYPGLKKLVVCSGSGDNDLPYLHSFQNIARPFEDQFEMEYLIGLPLEEMFAVTSSLESDSAIFLLPINRDNNQVFYTTDSIFPRFPEIANAPMFTFSDSTFGRGIVGGNLTSAKAYGEYTAEILHNIIRDPGYRITEYENTSIEMYDWRQLKRWKISEKKLPENSTVLFKEENFFEKYTIQIFFVSFILIFQTFWIVIMYIILKKQKRTEVLLRKNESKLQNTVSEKELLLREVHHRVKNNLAIVSSFLALQGMNLKDGKVHELLKSSQNRILSMAMIHEQLYRDEDLVNINLGTYIEQLSEGIAASYSEKSDDVKISLDIDDIDIDIDKLIPVGLIINEILSNSFKYAFSRTKKPEIRIIFRKDGQGKYNLKISDNGVGLPDNDEIENGGTIGFLLINTLVEQLQGSINIETQNGTEYDITF